MDKLKVAAAFNEWMRRYIEEPERFLREWQTVERFQAEANGGREPTYGERCAAYLEELMGENEAANQASLPPASIFIGK
jgi:hypothetical protein